MNDKRTIYNGKTAGEIQQAARNRMMKGVTPEATLRKQGAYDLMKQRHKFKLRMPG